MANADRPRGAEPSGKPRRKTAYQSGGAIFKGDCVTKDSDGEVIAASATTALLGVASNSTAGQGEEVQVYDHPDQEFVIQADGADVDAQTDIGLNYDLLATAGNAAYSQSRMELDSDTGDAVTATLPLKLQRIEPRDDNALGAQVDCVVQINNHQLKGGTGTVGV